MNRRGEWAPYGFIHSHFITLPTPTNKETTKTKRFRSVDYSIQEKRIGQRRMAMESFKESVWH